ncbi:hypothetical protein DFH08DRAFT_956830 [Mycena albidolilacea]|uniref:Uncharacterized protein n=1 Tax=Mycena albidolilacea TaxID=1033008 RepID=A0AAD7A8D5_9AGAR|nr:hypothetical protein DFH08DRAFT_956830 [Mycena albidolilacea]
MLTTSSFPSHHHGARSRVVPTSSSLFPNSFYRPSTTGPTESPADKGNGRTVPSSPKESDPDDKKKTGYVPVWLDDADTLGTMRDIDVASSMTDVSQDTHYKSYAPANNAFAQAVAKDVAAHEQQRTHAPHRGTLVVAIAEGGGDGDEEEGDGDGDGQKLELRLRMLAACDTSTNDNDRVAHRAQTADTRRRCFLLIIIPISMPIAIALPLFLPPSLPPSLFSDTYTRHSSPDTSLVMQASFTMHGRRRWGRQGRWGWGWARGGRKLRLRGPPDTPPPTTPRRTVLSLCVSTRAALLTLRLRLSSGSHIDAKPRRGARNAARAIDRETRPRLASSPRNLLY